MKTDKDFEKWHETNYTCESVKGYKHLRREGWLARDAYAREEQRVSARNLLYEIHTNAALREELAARDAELAEKDRVIEERDSILREIETILGADPDSDHSMLPEIIRGMSKTIDGLKAAIALRDEALRPFAKMAEKFSIEPYCSKWPDETRLTADDVIAYHNFLTIGQCREAAKVLATTHPDERRDE